MDKVSPKKHLGQHFLIDKNIAEKLAAAIQPERGFQRILEIGPGMGILTQFLLQIPQTKLSVVEIDTESVTYLEQNFPMLQGKIISGDFLKYDFLKAFDNEPFSIVGNFPYNISAPILFQLLEYKDYVPQLTGMFQREVAERIASPPGSKDYGILSVLLQAYFDVKLLFHVSEHVFQPKPKVKSAVLQLTRNTNTLDCDEKLMVRVVKTAFNQRRKIMRNSLKSICPDDSILADDIFLLRPEALHFSDFVEITKRFS
ncbi:MAG: 16S rRNA (adenine(1518)-N(6)/adenine(1519)-N(6))-dimethyltransferase RsmA [Bacteroidetes bacterium]|nr:16S rRNA (adenine(1518)-N(6)/adenine(1519)-N(6))-dimethyltransferase RsmA [Bacteroidota bacterium]MBU1718422.1 16S rRNA (adenine(1518)-N(6)/adenine(1519)-N(6))-dimethyltransferase RsmA [Bacteroidota bacterium]